MTAKPLNAAQERFVAELITDPMRNAKAAYERVYEARGNTAAAAAHRLLQDPRITARMAEGEAAMLKRNHITADELLNNLAERVKADPRELSEYWRGACRYCHGIEHKYQRRPQEYRQAFADYLKTPKGSEDPMGVFFDHLGGVGFDSRKAPHAACPECDGLGVGVEVIKDTRTLSRAAARLYAGLKVTKEGIEIKVRSQDRAEELLGKHLGLTRDPDSGNPEGQLPPPSAVNYTMEDAYVDPKAIS